MLVRSPETFASVIRNLVIKTYLKLVTLYAKISRKKYVENERKKIY